MINKQEDKKHKQSYVAVWSNFVVSILFGVALAMFTNYGWAQAVLANGSLNATQQAIIFPQTSGGILAALPNPTMLSTSISNLDANALDCFGTDECLVTDWNNHKIHHIKVSTATLIDTIDLSSKGYSGRGAIKVSPDQSVALAHDASHVFVISAPFDASAATTAYSISLGDSARVQQTASIDFDQNGRAFIYGSGYLSVMSPPYASVDFKIDLASRGINNINSGSIKLTPDNSKLLVTNQFFSVYVFDAPFSGSSTYSSRISTPCNTLNGIDITPDGNTAIAVGLGEICIISAPFTTGAATVRIPLLGENFEDLDISYDGQLAILCGGSSDTNTAVYFIKAPFNISSEIYGVTPISGGRGGGACRFLPSSVTPQLTVSKTGLSSINAGGELTYTLNYGNTATTSANNVVLRDTIPTGTNFVSATDGGTLQGSEVVWSLGTITANTPSAGSVTFTVQVNAAPGMVIANDDYSIEDGSSQLIHGNAVQTLVNDPPVYNLLTVNKTGTGSGTVASVSGINCGSDCSESYSDGESVVLTAVADADSTFTGWSGDCSGTGACTVTMSTDRNVTANFAAITYTLTAATTGTGTGTVTSNPTGITCGADCNESYTDGQTVTLTATPNSGSTFTGWSGDCSGTGACTVTMSTDRNVTASFTLASIVTQTLKVGKTGTGQGVVISSDGDINCGTLCRADYPANTTVTLTATPAPGSSFLMWRNSCVGTNPTTTVKMSTGRYCVALFR